MGWPDIGSHEHTMLAGNSTTICIVLRLVTSTKWDNDVEEVGNLLWHHSVPAQFFFLAGLSMYSAHNQITFHSILVGYN